MLRYACERVARSLWKTGWRQVSRHMERAALFEALATTEQRYAMNEHRINVIFAKELQDEAKP